MALTAFEVAFLMAKFDQSQNFYESIPWPQPNS